MQSTTCHCYPMDETLFNSLFGGKTPPHYDSVVWGQDPTRNVTESVILPDNAYSITVNEYIKGNSDDFWLMVWISVLLFLYACLAAVKGPELS